MPLEDDVARKVLQLVDALEDLDDVQNVWANFDISDEVLESRRLSRARLPRRARGRRRRTLPVRTPVRSEREGCGGARARASTRG